MFEDRNALALCYHDNMYYPLTFSSTGSVCRFISKYFQVSLCPGCVDDDSLLFQSSQKGALFYQISQLLRFLILTAS